VLELVAPPRSLRVAARIVGREEQPECGSQVFGDVEEVGQVPSLGEAFQQVGPQVGGTIDDDLERKVGRADEGSARRR